MTLIAMKCVNPFSSLPFWPKEAGITRNQARDQTRVSKEPAGLDFEPAGLELKPVGLELEPAGLEFGPKSA